MIYLETMIIAESVNSKLVYSGTCNSDSLL